MKKQIKIMIEAPDLSLQGAEANLLAGISSGAGASVEHVVHIYTLMHMLDAGIIVICSSIKKLQKFQ